MKQFDGLQSLQQPLSGLPQWVSERILQQINQLTHYEPVIGIMGIPLVVAATYTSPFIPLNANKFHESKHEKSTCYNFGGGEALSVARCSLANVTYSSA